MTYIEDDNGEVYWSLANLKTYRFPPEEIATIETRIADPAIEESSRLELERLDREALLKVAEQLHRTPVTA